MATQIRPNQEAAPAMWYCWKARPLSEFPRFQRWIIRKLYDWFGWSKQDESREGLCIAYSEEEAREIISHFKGGNAQPFPVARTVEDALPDQMVQYGKRIPADPEAQKHYVRRSFKRVGVNADLLNETRELAGQFKRRKI
jgi:hypothetical protein